LATASADSGVIGQVLARPRMPSVPKSLRVMARTYGKGAALGKALGLRAKRSPASARARASAASRRLSASFAWLRDCESWAATTTDNRGNAQRTSTRTIPALQFRPGGSETLRTRGVEHIAQIRFVSSSVNEHCSQ
jgi:hypothetical protein